VAEPGAERIRSLLAGGIAATSRISEAEVGSALCRRCREGAFPPEERDRALAALRQDLATLLMVELTTEVSWRAVGLMTRLSLHAADSVQLASCLEVRDRLKVPCLFVCGDSRLLAAARQEGLSTAP
jgi:predicted nucleic acid-binding protein